MNNASKDILHFWFEQTSPEQHFKKDPAFDQTVKDKFLPTYEHIVETNAADYKTDAESYLAAIIVLDQFSRNMFRGDAKSFAADDLALSLAQEAVDKELDQDLPADRRAFIYMPYMHSESPEVHEEAFQLFKNLGNENNLKYEKLHKEIIDRFGRYPHRNEILGRESTQEEKKFLNTHDGF